MTLLKRWKRIALVFGVTWLASHGLQSQEITQPKIEILDTPIYQGILIRPEYVSNAVYLFRIYPILYGENKQLIADRVDLKLAVEKAVGEATTWQELANKYRNDFMKLAKDSAGRETRGWLIGGAIGLGVGFIVGLVFLSIINK